MKKQRHEDYGNLHDAVFLLSVSSFLKTHFLYRY